MLKEDHRSAPQIYCRYPSVEIHTLHISYKLTDQVGHIFTVIVAVTATKCSATPNDGFILFTCCIYYVYYTTSDLYSFSMCYPRMRAMLHWIACTGHPDEWISAHFKRLSEILNIGRFELTSQGYFLLMSQRTVTYKNIYVYTTHTSTPNGNKNQWPCAFLWRQHGIYS